MPTGFTEWSEICGRRSSNAWVGPAFAYVTPDTL